MIREALLYEKLEDSRVQCLVCAHQCKINPGRRGLCGVRENKKGILFTMVFGTLIAENVDPIEKKPFFHVYPGSRSFSIATVGCNFSCSFCQNHDISQLPRSTFIITGEDTAPETVTRLAKDNNCQTIAYTYTEPTVYLETALETSKIACSEGLKNVFVTNGYMSEPMLSVMKPYLSAANVDLKSFRDAFYKQYCSAKLSPVLSTLEKLKEKGVWVEITTLLIPGLNDSESELKDIAHFICKLGNETPWHISRFHPRYKMLNHPVTPVASVRRACEIGKEAGLKYVYSGNVPGDEGENTYCSNCSELLIKRFAYRITSMNLSGNTCSSCGHPLDGIF